MDARRVWKVAVGRRRTPHKVRTTNRQSVTSWLHPDEGRVTAAEGGQ